VWVSQLPDPWSIDPAQRRHNIPPSPNRREYPLRIAVDVAVDSVSSPAYHAECPKVVLYIRRMNVNHDRGSSAGLDEEGRMIARTLADKKRLVSVIWGICSPRSLCLLLLPAILVGGTTAPRKILDVEGISYATLHKEPERGVLVITEVLKGSIWFGIDGSTVYHIDNVPSSSGSGVWGLAISPDDKYLAAYTSSPGAGAEGVDVFPLEPVIRNKMGSTEKRHVLPVASVFAWPAQTQMIGWKDNTTLEIRSSRPLHLSTPDNRGVDDPYEYPSEHFLWDIPTDTIRKK
jgi:hypothetical protein